MNAKQKKEELIKQLKEEFPLHFNGIDDQSLYEQVYERLQNDCSVKELEEILLQLIKKSNK
jgi:hypothetical protein